MLVEYDHEHRFTEHEYEITGLKTPYVLPTIIPEEPDFLVLVCHFLTIYMVVQVFSFHYL
jgi:hypothetical protein